MSAHGSPQPKVLHELRQRERREAKEREQQLKKAAKAASKQTPAQLQEGRS